MKLEELRAKLREMFDPKVELSRAESADTTPKRADLIREVYLEASARYDEELRRREHYRDCSRCKRPFFVALDDDAVCGFCRRIK